MKLLQTFITVFLVQIFGFFLIQPIFALSTEGIHIVSAVTMSDNCGTNIQCYEVGTNEYRCENTDSWMGNASSPISSIQSGKTDGVIYAFIPSYLRNQGADYQDKKLLYKNPECDIYPFVGIIKIQV